MGDRASTEKTDADSLREEQTEKKRNRLGKAECKGNRMGGECGENREREGWKEVMAKKEKETDKQRERVSQAVIKGTDYARYPESTPIAREQGGGD